VRPDNYGIGRETCPIKYDITGAKLMVSTELGRQLKTKYLPKLEALPAMRVYIKDEGYTDIYVDSSKVETLAEKIEARRLDLVWQAFQGEHRDQQIEVKPLEDLPALPQIEPYDPVTGTMAYPAYRVSYSSWYIKWYRTAEEADQANKTALKQKAEIDRKEDERLHFEERKSEAEKLYPQVEELSGKIDWDNYKPYGIKSDEASSYSGLRAMLQEAKQLAGLTGYTPQPSKALELLREIESRLETAIASYEERQTKVESGEIWPDVSVKISSASQTHTQAFCIALDGSQVEPQDSEGAFGDLPATHLVLKHETSTYNYMCSEEWEVVILPQKITEEQIQTVKRLEDETRQSFRDQGTGWNLEKAGVVSFTTAYARDLSGEDYEAYEQMRESFPVDVNGYES